MRSYLFMLAMPVLCAAQQAQAPIISFETLHHNFGKVNTERPLSYRFKLTNKGTAPLQIKRLNASCGCTSTVMDQNKWYLRPGESNAVEVTFNPTGFRGLVRKSVNVESDDPQNPSVTLSFEAEVIREIMVEPGALFFREMLPSTPSKKTLKLVSGDGVAFQVSDVKTPGAPYLSQAWHVEGKDVIVEVTFDGRKVPPGVRNGADKLSIRTTHPRVPYLPVDVLWDFKTLIWSTPDRVVWTEPSGKEHRVALSLKHEAGKPFRVLSASSSNPQIRVEGIGKTSAPEQHVQIVMAADVKAGSYSEEVVLSLDDPDQSDLRVRVNAILK
jgi:hypothetical protein